MSKTRDLLLEQALLALEDSAGIQGALLPTAPGAAPWVELRRGASLVHLKVLPLPALRSAHLDLLGTEKGATEQLLVTRQVSAPLAQQLRRLGLQFIDSAGNAWLENERWMVNVVGRKAPEAPKERGRLSPAALQVGFVLLRDSDAGTLSLRELGHRAGVSHGAVALGLQAMEARGWLRYLGAKGQPVADWEGLLQAWAFGYADRLCARNYVTRGTPAGFTSLQAWREEVLPRLGASLALLGGELAAENLGYGIIASSAVVHVPDWNAATLRSLRLLPSERGEVVVRRCFGTENQDPDHPRQAHPLLVLGELSALNDSRLMAARVALRQSVLDQLRERA